MKLLKMRRASKFRPMVYCYDAKLYFTKKFNDMIDKTHLDIKYNFKTKTLVFTPCEGNTTNELGIVKDSLKFGVSKIQGKGTNYCIVSSNNAIKILGLKGKTYSIRKVGKVFYAKI